MKRIQKPKIAVRKELLDFLKIMIDEWEKDGVQTYEDIIIQLLNGKQLSPEQKKRFHKRIDEIKKNEIALIEGRYKLEDKSKFTITPKEAYS